MTWREIADLLNGLQSQFPHARRTLAGWGKPESVFQLLEHQTSESLDEAIRAFAKTRVWPPLSDDQKAMLGFRLDFAWHIAAAMCESSNSEKLFPTAQLSDSDQLEWILVEAWGWPGSPYWEGLTSLAQGKAPDALDDPFHDRN